MSHRLQPDSFVKNGETISISVQLVCAESFEKETCSFEEDRAKYMGTQSVDSLAESIQVINFGEAVSVPTEIKVEKEFQLDSTYLDELTSDVTFACGPEDCENVENVPAHKLILSLHSPVYKTMFYGSMPEKPVIRLTDATADGLKEFLQMFYKDKVYPTIDNAAEVIYLAKKYEVDHFYAVYSKFLQQNLSIGQLIRGLELAIRLDLPQLNENFTSKIVVNHKHCFKTEEFLSCSTNMLQTIIRLEDIKQHAEEIFFWCIEWARNVLKRQKDTKNEPTLSEIREKIGDHFNLIEFGSVRCGAIMNILYDFNEFFTRKDLLKINTILALKYSVKNADWELISCKLFVVDSAHSADNYITDAQVISFWSSKSILFVGYEQVEILQNRWAKHHNLWLILTKKSSTPELIDDIVLLRHRLDADPSIFEQSNQLINEFIKIEPNVKYEIRIKSSRCGFEKYYTKTLFTSNECDLGDGEKLSIEGFSPVISSLLFKSHALFPI